MSFEARTRSRSAFSKTHWRLSVVAALLLAAGLVGCQSPEDESASESAPPVVDVTAVDYAFQVPDTVRSGWTTLRMTNEGEEHHLFLLAQLPENVSYAEFHDEVVVPWDSIRSLVRAGSVDTSVARTALKRLIPDWYPDGLTPMGGVSLTAPGRTATTTLHLEPGTYVMECYLRTADRQFHLMRGMARRLVATPDSTNASTPEADLSLSLSKGQIQADSTVASGQYTIAVDFGEKGTLGPVGHHLHLARLDPGTSARDLARWMKWDPIMPAPVEFLGGAQSMLKGRTAYLQVDLSPGRYVWVLGNPPKQGAVQPFTVE